MNSAAGASFRTVLKLNKPVHGENPQQLGSGGVSESFLNLSLTAFGVALSA